MTEGSVDVTQDRRSDRVAGSEVHSLNRWREVHLDNDSSSVGWLDVDVQCKETLDALDVRRYYLIGIADS